MPEDSNQDLTELTVELLAAFVANNNVRPDDLPKLISSTHEALAGLAAAPSQETTAVEQVYEPAVKARKSLADRDFIISMIDGKRYKSLKRHLTGHGLTPATYRERYKLPIDYPMVAPGYSDTRREVAKRLGLGRKPKSPEPAPGAKTPRRPRTVRSLSADTGSKTVGETEK